MSLLLPQTQAGTVPSARPLDIHGDGYVDIALILDAQPDAPVTGRLAATECPADLAPGEPVEARFVMSVITRLIRVEALRREGRVDAGSGSERGGPNQHPANPHCFA